MSGRTGVPINRRPKTAVVLLNWNSTNDTLACVDSLLKGTYGRFHIYLVENGSREDEKRKLIQEIQKREKVTPIYLSENSGFAAGNNVALKLAILEKYDFYLLLNNDTVAAEDFLEKFIACAQNHPDGGAFGAKIFYYDPADVLWYAGGDVRPLKASVVQHGFREKDSEKWSREREISFVTGCAFLIPHKTLEKVGYLDDTFFSYFEDVEYSIRIKKMGYSLRYCPEARVWHKVGAGAQSFTYTPYYLYYQTRNRWRAFASQRSIFFKGYLFILNFFLYFLGRIVYILTSKSENKRKQLKAVLLGYVHGLIGKKGRERQWEKSEM
ncbi:MAG TPA: glycosyltransferase family 2 protein [Bacteroidetes bacterium]|nr:glycosyltransferase family 2 protein [Bacteroidota bacterium]HDZ13261.1 glycosyltransferase family 2 protein [Bacteroidota bacterium]